MHKIIAPLVTALILFAPTVVAVCKKSNVCDDYGRNCKVMDVCDSKLDLPSVGLPPLQPLPSTKIKPLPSMQLPPIGASKCEFKQVNGEWKNVCR